MCSGAMIVIQFIIISATVIAREKQRKGHYGRMRKRGVGVKKLLLRRVLCVGRTVALFPLPHSFFGRVFKFLLFLVLGVLFHPTSKRH